MEDQPPSRGPGSIPRVVLGATATGLAIGRRLSRCDAKRAVTKGSSFGAKVTLPKPLGDWFRWLLEKPRSGQPACHRPSAPALVDYLHRVRESGADRPHPQRRVVGCVRIIGLRCARKSVDRQGIRRDLSTRCRPTPVCVGRRSLLGTRPYARAGSHTSSVAGHGAAQRAAESTPRGEPTTSASGPCPCTPLLPGSSGSNRPTHRATLHVLRSTDSVASFCPCSPSSTRRYGFPDITVAVNV
jgi:hypothetical protein